VKADDLEAHAVWLTVWSKQKWKGLFLGETVIPLSLGSLAGMQRIWLPLSDFAQS